MQRQIPWWFLLVKGLFILIIGLFFLTDPKNAAKSLAFYIGLLLFLGGLFSFYHVYQQRKRGDSPPSSYLIPGMVLISGIILLFFTQYALFLFALSIGLWILIDGISQIRSGGEVKKIDVGMGRFLVFMGVVSVILSLLIILNPQGLVNFISIIFGLILSISGVFLIGLGISTR